MGSEMCIRDSDSHLYSIDADDGKVRWKINLNGAVFSSPAVTDKSIYVGSSDGYMYAVNRSDGTQRWRFLVKEGVNVWTSPVAMQGMLYFGSHAGDVIALQEKPKSE